jgi:hypothetical protein
MDWIKGEQINPVSVTGVRTALTLPDEEHEKPEEKPAEHRKIDELDWAHFHYEGKRFESKAVSRGEFEALKRFGTYELLSDDTLMRMEGDKEFRIHCSDTSKFPYGVFTVGFCNMLSESYDRMRQEELEGKHGEGSL